MKESKVQELIKLINENPKGIKLSKYVNHNWIVIFIKKKKLNNEYNIEEFNYANLGIFNYTVNIELLYSFLLQLKGFNKK